MTIDDIIQRTRVALTEGRVYGVKIDGYTFEGTYAGIEGQNIILQTGNKYSTEGGRKSFDRQELPIRIARNAYPL